jgi:molybdate transport system substrate-binding protein
VTRKTPVPALSIALLCALQAASPAQAQDAAPVRVLAAASLTEVVEALAGGFRAARVETSFGGSSALARQIRDGAPADVFLSASPEWVAYLAEAGALAGDELVFARNRLVCVAAAGSSRTRGVGGARGLLDRIRPDGRVAIADEGVPAGEYARSALVSLGLLESFGPLLVGQQDVRAVLHAVERGELDAGFVYATDARIAAVDVLFELESETHPPIEYVAAALRGARNPAGARAFLDHLRSPAARERLAAAGFALP